MLMIMENGMVFYPMFVILFTFINVSMYVILCMYTSVLLCVISLPACIWSALIVSFLPIYMNDNLFVLVVQLLILNYTSTVNTQISFKKMYLYF